MRRTASGIRQAVGPDRSRRGVVDPDSELNLRADPAHQVRACGVDLTVFAGNDGCRYRAIQLRASENTADLFCAQARGWKPVDLPDAIAPGDCDFRKRVADVDEQDPAHARTISGAAAKVKPRNPPPPSL